MDINFRINKANLADIEKELGIALEQTAQSMLTDTVESQRMPFLTGTMQNTQTEVESYGNKDVAIVTSAPQARRLYYHPEYKFTKTFNKDAGGLWWNPFIIGEKKNLPSEWFKEFARRRLRRYDS